MNIAIGVCCIHDWWIGDGVITLEEYRAARLREAAKLTNNNRMDPLDRNFEHHYRQHHPQRPTPVTNPNFGGSQQNTVNQPRSSSLNETPLGLRPGDLDSIMSITPGTKNTADSDITSWIAKMDNNQNTMSTTSITPRTKKTADSDITSWITKMEEQAEADLAEVPNPLSRNCNQPVSLYHQSLI